MDSHLQSNMREHLDLACVKLNSTQVQLDEQRVQLHEQRVQLDETRVQLVETQAKLSCLTDEVGRQNCFIWKTKPFSECFRQAKQGVKEMIESDPFYTGRYGYKLKVFAHPCFSRYSLSSRGPPLSIGIFLMEGEYDDILPWPFSKKITFTIIDQNKDIKQRKNIAKSISPGSLRWVDDMIFSERPREEIKEVKSEPLLMVSQKILQTRRYIVNDTLFLQVDVEAYSFD